MEKDVIQFLVKFWRDQEGVTAIEYGLIAALVAVAIIVAVGGVGDELERLFDFIAETLSGRPGGGGDGG